MAGSAWLQAVYRNDVLPAESHDPSMRLLNPLFALLGVATDQ